MESISEILITDQAKLTFKSAALIFRAINHKIRQQMLEHLWYTGSSVTDLYVKLRLEQSVCSSHLAILRKADLVKTFKSGKVVIYSTNVNRFKEYLAYAESINNSNTYKK